VNAFTVAGFALLFAFVPLLLVCLVSEEIDGVAAVELCGALATLIFLCLGEGFHRSAYFDVPVISAAATWIGGIVFVRFLGRYN
jgi:multisubunit Na+/H+ antiporter MnhF subunit